MDSAHIAAGIAVGAVVFVAKLLVVAVVSLCGVGNANADANADANANANANGNTNVAEWLSWSRGNMLVTNNVLFWRNIQGLVVHMESQHIKHVATR